MTNTKHSDKALHTIALMNTTPAQWKGADILWKLEKRMVWGEVACPDCLGGRVVAKDADGKIIRPPQRDDEAFKGSSFEYNESVRAYEKLAGKLGHSGNCDKCRVTNPRARAFGWCTGKVAGKVERMVHVGVVQWPDDVRFDSRFCTGGCQLCNKTIYASNRVPVVGLGSDGVSHGMWVGVDCARKFLPGVYLYEAPKEPKGAPKREVVLEGAGMDA